SANQDGSSIVAQSDWSARPLELTDGILTNGQTYYWHAEAKGALNDGSGDSDTLSPTWSFVATADPALSDSTGTPMTTQATSPQDSSASGCPSWLFIGVRGTNEPAGSGRTRWGHGFTSGGLGEMKQVAQKLKNDQHATIESLDYPATWSGVVGPAYWNSVAAGVQALASEVNAVASRCSSTKLWLGGHSQGAHVVENTIAKRVFSQRAVANFRGAVLAGDPTYKNSDKDDAPGNGTDNGPLVAFHNNVSTWIKVNNKGKRVTLVRSWCFSNDIFCQRNGWSLPVHNSYGNEPTPTNEEKWLRQFA
ncbi:cutinase family protein, partial [Curtobacterium sp. B8]|uniref:cutinase family protein n=1 Tax=Curtobacterium sp. B8 TaxID=95611 RepID=UPI0011D28D4B